MGAWAGLVVMLAAGVCGAAEPEVRLQREAGRVAVAIGGRPVTVLHYGPGFDKPFLHPLRTLAGVVVSRGFPFEKTAGESSDHPWHRGVWWAHGDINGVDFWREKGRQETGRIVVRGEPGISGPAIHIEADLVTPRSEVLGSVAQTFRFARDGENAAIDAAISIRADRGAALRLGDTEEGFLGVRLSDAFRQDRGAVLLNSDGLKDTEHLWGKRAAWVDYSALVDGRHAGVAVFDHPENPRHPTWWHARPYGLNAANPLGERAFTRDRSRDGSLTIPPGGSLAFRYRVLLHDGEGEVYPIENSYRRWAGAALAKTPAREPRRDLRWRLEFEDRLAQHQTLPAQAARRVQKGRITAGGWTPDAPDARVFVELARGFAPGEPGRVELDITNFDPQRQYAASGVTKSHLLSMFSYADGKNDTGRGAPHECDWQIRGGKNYLSAKGPGAGFKFLWRNLGTGTRRETRLIHERTSWDPAKTYTLAVVWDEQAISFRLGGEVLLNGPFLGRRKELKYLYIGDDDYIPGVKAIPGPVYKALRVYRAE